MTRDVTAVGDRGVTFQIGNLGETELPGPWDSLAWPPAKDGVAYVGAPLAFLESSPPPAKKRTRKVICGWHGTDMCGPDDGSKRRIYLAPQGYYLCGQYAGYMGARFAFEGVYRDNVGFVPDHKEFERLRTAGKVERYYECPCTQPEFDSSQWCPCTPGPEPQTFDPARCDECGKPIEATPRGCIPTLDHPKAFCSKCNIGMAESDYPAHAKEHESGTIN